MLFSLFSCVLWTDRPFHTSTHQIGRRKRRKRQKVNSSRNVEKKTLSFLISFYFLVFLVFLLLMLYIISSVRVLSSSRGTRAAEQNQQAETQSWWSSPPSSIYTVVFSSTSAVTLDIFSRNHHNHHPHYNQRSLEQKHKAKLVLTSTQFTNIWADLLTITHISISSFW